MLIAVTSGLKSFSVFALPIAPGKPHLTATHVPYKRNAYTPKHGALSPIVTWSRSMTDAEKHDTTKRESIVDVWSVRLLRSKLEGT